MMEGAAEAAKAVGIVFGALGLGLLLAWILRP